MKLKRLISAIVAVGMMVTMLPVSAVTAFAAESGAPVELTVTMSGEQSLQDATEKAAKAEGVELDDITSLKVITENGAELVREDTRDDFRFMSGVSVKNLGDEGHWDSFYAGDPGENKVDYTYLKNLKVLDLSEAKCKDDILPARAFYKNLMIEQLILPETLKETKIRSISGMTALTCLGPTAGTVYFPDSIEILGESTVADDVNLSGELHLPANLKELGSACFNGCGKQSATGVTGKVVIPAQVSNKWNVYTNSAACTSSFSGTNVEEITIEENSKITSIVGNFASGCKNLKSVTIPYGVTEIGGYAFNGCTNLATITIPSSVTSIAGYAFKDCTSLTTIHYNGTKAQWEALKASMGAGNTVLDNITPEFISAKLTTDIGEKIFVVGTPVEFTFSTVANSDAGIVVKGTSNFSDTDAIEKLEYYEVKDGNWYELKGDFGAGTGFPMTDATSKFRVTFKKAGTYTFTASMEKADGTGTLCETNVEFTVREKAPNLTVTGGTVVSVMDGENDITEDAHIVTTGNTTTAIVPAGAIVTVKYTEQSDAINFDLWSFGKCDKELLGQFYKSKTFSFQMPADHPVTMEAMTKDATIEDDSSEALGITAAVVTGAVGTAVLTYQGYMLGTELYLTYLLPAGAAIPANRAELAMLVWQDAGKPEPAAPVALDAADDVKALTWAVETGLMDDTDKNGEDLAADASVSRIDVIKMWKKAQALKES